MQRLSQGRSWEEQPRVRSNGNNRGWVMGWPLQPQIFSPLGWEWIKQGNTWNTHVTSQTCCLFERLQSSNTLISPAELCLAAPRPSRASGSLWVGKVPPTPPASRALRPGEQLGGAVPHLFMAVGQRGHTQRPPVSTMGLPPPALLSGDPPCPGSAQGI